MKDADKELRQTLVQKVREIKEEYEYPDLGRAFQHWAAVNVLGIGDEMAYDALDDGVMSRDSGIDYFHVDTRTKTVEIMQAKFHENADPGAAREDLCSLCMTIDRLNESDGGVEIFKTYQAQYREAVKSNFTIRLVFVMMGSFTEENYDEINVCRKKNPHVTLQCLETKDLLGLIGNPNSERCTLELFDNEWFVSNGTNGEIKNIVATVRAKELKRIHDEIGASVLFSVNPRLFLGARKRVAKNIKETLEESPKYLWHFNNGVSAVCKHFYYNEESNTVTIENLKIVNGCQTVTTIGLSKHPIDGDAKLLFRLSEVDDKDFQTEISKNTNDQNPTQHTDLNSDKPELMLLEHKFGKYSPFFWERKRGQFDLSEQKKNVKIKGRRPLYVLTNVGAAKLKLAYELEAPHQSLQLPQEKIFDDSPITNSNKIKPFSGIYKNADPLDFILPNIFYYYLGVIKKTPNVNKRILALVSLDVGKYYVIAVIGKILRSMQPEEKDEISTRIVKAAIDLDDLKIEGLKSKLGDLVYGIAECLEYVLDNKKQLEDYKREELKASLRKGIFDNVYRERKKVNGVRSGQTDPFETSLKQLFDL